MVNHCEYCGDALTCAQCNPNSYVQGLKTFQSDYERLQDQRDELVSENVRLKAELEEVKKELAIRDWMIKLALKDIHWISTTVMQKTCNDIETMMDKYRAHAENALADIESEAVADAVQTTTPGSKI